MKFKKICFLIVMVFAVLGCIFTSVTLHEYSHNFDFINYAEDPEICVLNLPALIPASDSALGYYAYSYNRSDKEAIYEIKQTTEIKAYAITIAVGLIFIISFAVVWFHWLWLNSDMEEFEEELK